MDDRFVFYAKFYPRNTFLWILNNSIKKKWPRNSTGMPCWVYKEWSNRKLIRQPTFYSFAMTSWLRSRIQNHQFYCKEEIKILKSGFLPDMRQRICGTKNTTLQTLRRDVSFGVSFGLECRSIILKEKLYLKSEPKIGHFEGVIEIVLRI